MEAVAACRSAGEVCELEGIRAAFPEIIVPLRSRLRSATVVVHRSDARAAMMPRDWVGITVTGVEATLLSLAHALDREAFEIAFEDARRRRLTSLSAVRAYMDRFGSGRTGAPVGADFSASSIPCSRRVRSSRSRLDYSLWIKVWATTCASSH